MSFLKNIIYAHIPLSPWISNGDLKVNVSKMELLSLKTYANFGFPMFIDDNSTLQVFWTCHGHFLKKNMSTSLPKRFLISLSLFYFFP